MLNLVNSFLTVTSKRAVRQYPLGTFVEITSLNMVALRASFSTTQALRQLPSHPLYTKVDWARVSAGEYAVVDPMDSTAVLYLTEREYKVQIRVSMRQDHKLLVLAVAGSSPSTSPLARERAQEARQSAQKGYDFRGRVDTFTTHLRENLLDAKVAVQQEDGSVLIVPSESNLRRLLSTWFTKTLFWGVGIALLVPSVTYRGAPVKGRWHFKLFEEFLFHLTTIVRDQGPSGLVLRMKSMLYILNRYMGGNPCKSSRDTGIPIKLDRRGLPQAFPLPLRDALTRGRSSGDFRLMRVWASLLFSYKAMHCPGLLKISTIITRPTFKMSEVMDTVTKMGEFAHSKFWKALSGQGVDSYPEDGKHPFVTKDSFLTTAGANDGDCSGSNAEIDALAWFRLARGRDEISVLLRWARQIGDKLLFDQLERLELLWMRETNGLKGYEPSENLIQLKAYFKSFLTEKFTQDTAWIWKTVDKRPSVGKTKTGSTGLALQDLSRPKLKDSLLRLGRLCIKYEAAGKVRVFAICDHWTQRICTPIHSWMESILRKLPADCTFDQDGGLEAFVEKGLMNVSSFDLSAATDRIPIVLYQVVFGASKTMGPTTTNLWLELLAKRHWWLPGRTLTSLGVTSLKAVSRTHPFAVYLTGQPMGAKSSWPSMALVHHFMVHFARFRATGAFSLEWADYVVLGDDVAIGCPATAHEYKLLCEEFGISIGLHKSYISETGMVNFANQTFIAGQNVSPLSLKEEIEIHDIFGRFEMSRRIVKRWSQISTTSSWNISHLVKTMMGPFKWVAEVEPLARNGKMRSDVRAALLLWLTPSSSQVRTLGLVNLSVAPLTWVLTQSRRLWDCARCVQDDVLVPGGHPGLRLRLWTSLIEAHLAELRRDMDSIYDALGGFDRHFMKYAKAYGYGVDRIKLFWFKYLNKLQGENFLARSQLAVVLGFIRVPGTPIFYESHQFGKLVLMDMSDNLNEENFVIMLEELCKFNVVVPPFHKATGPIHLPEQDETVDPMDPPSARRAKDKKPLMKTAEAALKARYKFYAEALNKEGSKCLDFLDSY